MILRKPSRKGHLLVSLFCVTTSTFSYSLENTKVLPKGVRNVTLKTVQSMVSEKSNSSGHLEPLSKPLSKDLKFKNVVNGEEGAKRSALEAFLMHEKFSLDDSLGQFHADMKGSIQVIAPVMSYGVSDDLTVAMAIPYYQAKTKVALSFRSNEMANTFLNRLHSEGYNQTAAAQEASDKLRNAVGELNKKLAKNNYKSLNTWEGKGLGDSTLAAKYRILNGEQFKLATTSGVVVPTGKTQDPDALTAIPFGDGNWDLFTSVGVDEPIMSSLFLNQYAKYTYQTYAKRDVRLATEDESIEVETQKNARYKLGDKIETGFSVQYEPDFGLVTGLGYVYNFKFSDSYNLTDPQAKAKIQANTTERSEYVEYRLGYSTIPAFQRKEIKVPLSATLELKKHLASQNSVVKDMVTIDLALFF